MSHPSAIPMAATAISADGCCHSGSYRARQTLAPQFRRDQSLSCSSLTRATNHLLEPPRHIMVQCKLRLETWWSRPMAQSRSRGTLAPQQAATLGMKYFDWLYGQRARNGSTSSTRILLQRPVMHHKSLPWLLQIEETPRWSIKRASAGHACLFSCLSTCACSVAVNMNSAMVGVKFYHWH